MAASNNDAYLALMKRFERKSYEQHISYFGRHGDIKTFYFTPPSSVFKPECVNEPMVLTGTDGVTLLFLVKCKFFTPRLTAPRADAPKELQDKTGMPAHLGFFDYVDYQLYFEPPASENRIIKANDIVTSWVSRNIPCGKPVRGKQRDAMPLELRRIFKGLANNGYFDIVPEDTVAYFPPADGGTVELPGFIDPQKHADESQWFYPKVGHYPKLKEDGWRLRFPKASTHAILKWSQDFQKLIDRDEERENDPSPYEVMKKTTEAAITLFKKEAKEAIVTDQ